MVLLEEHRIKQWLVNYLNPEATYKDIVTVTTHYQNLQPFKDTYVFLDGSQKELINLNGTIPVRYKGTVYNIPVCVWLMDTHPQHAPLCYVKPTPDMSIKVSQFVDQNGKIYLPYLHDWCQTTSELVGLIQVMIVTFGETPPVFARSRSADMPYPPSQYPMQAGASYSPYNQPPYPVASNFPSFPYPPTSTTSFSSYPTFPSPYPPYTVNAAASAGTGTIKEEHIKESLLTAIEEKLMRRMNEEFQQNQAELDTLKRTQDELKLGNTKLQAILEGLQKEKNDLDKNITVLKDKEQELDKAIERLSKQESIDVDDAVTTTAPLYKQLLNAFAEEAALEDAIYYMGEALRRGVIDLEIFLRQVRTLSRKQFMLRALMQKCRQKAGLANI
ncbi:TSG101 [Trypoxylus dichotomus]